MPIINGQKMACAPCIRGHRSTKCNHFYDRVMIPVRKPGRPLSTCPCPPGRPCACGGVRVAIPKKQKCGCSTGDEDRTEGEVRARPPAEPPTSPSRPPFRVGKPNGVSKAGSRKQSFEVANLERMDPRSVNLIAAPGSNGVANGMTMAGESDIRATQADANDFSAGLGAVPVGTGSQFVSPQATSYGSPIAYNMGFHYTAPNQLQHGVKLESGGLYSGLNGAFEQAISAASFANENHTAPPNKDPALPAMPAMSAQPLASKVNGSQSGSSSCCGSKVQEAPPPQMNGAISDQRYGQPPMAPPPGSSSCCGNKAQEPSLDLNDAAIPQQAYGQAYLAHFQYPIIFRYPGDYGSWQHPIDPVIWQQVVSQAGMPVTTPMSSAPNGGDAVDAGTSHQCGCGEGCQCVGCLAHPFNAQMFQYVNNAYSGSNGSSPGATDAGGGSVAPPVAAGQETPQEAPTPAASEGSPRTEEQSLSTMDYFFVNLPISGLCGGNLESCPCGDSCECPGCLVHNVPLRPG